ncbi:hypothetical protein [Streptomyces halobius]|uniref:Uncharacterized protein n=1 Tax=Streptomyces halobius TaxID=2879846 RepID=A0ABY4MHU5_9ACTN|nr:hypothetical protein [Streptomyces halobius]UQA97272.1 hypothetical protein K9S39_40260 [Streptomyces halobius]
MSKIERYAAIRRDHRGGMSMRELERKYGVSLWRPARLPGRYRTRPRSRPAGFRQAADAADAAIDTACRCCGCLDPQGVPRHRRTALKEQMSYRGSLAEL